MKDEGFVIVALFMSVITMILIVALNAPPHPACDARAVAHQTLPYKD